MRESNRERRCEQKYLPVPSVRNRAVPASIFMKQLFLIQCSNGCVSIHWVIPGVMSGHLCELFYSPSLSTLVFADNAANVFWFSTRYNRHSFHIHLLLSAVIWPSYILSSHQCYRKMLVQSIDWFYNIKSLQ